MATKICPQCNDLHQDVSPFCSIDCYHIYVGAKEDSGHWWGPEDGGGCPCGGVSCDGTCDSNSESAFDYENEWHSDPTYTCLTAEDQAFTDVVIPFVGDDIPF